MSKHSVRTNLEADLKEDADLEGCVAIGWVAVMEVMSPDGNTWLVKRCGDATDESLSPWREAGYLYSFLHDQPSCSCDDE